MTAWVTRNAPTPAREYSAGSSYALVLLVFLVGWGLGLTVAVQYVAGFADIGGGRVGAADAIRSATRDATQGLGTLALALVVARARWITVADLGLTLPRTPRQRGLDAAGLLVSFLSVAVFFALGRTIAYPREDPSAWAVVADVPSSLFAGPCEEIGLLALLVCLLRQARQHIGVILAVAVVLRWSFHLYYAGPWEGSPLPLVRTLAIMGWALAVAVWFLWSGRVLGLVIAHSIWDLNSAVGTLGGDRGYVFVALIVGSLMVAAMVLVILWRRAEREASAPTPPDLAAQVEEIVARAAAAGRSICPTPIAFIAATPSEHSHAYPKPDRRTGRPRIRLSQDLAALPPEERAWTIAHELSHVLLFQEVGAPKLPRRFLAGAVVTAATTATALAWLHAGPLVAAGGATAALLLGLTAALLAGDRQREGACDRAAAGIFGEVLTPAGVDRISRAEGLARYLPAAARTHPLPAARRQLGLDALGHMPSPLAAARPPRT